MLVPFKEAGGGTIFVNARYVVHIRPSQNQTVIELIGDRAVVVDEDTQSTVSRLNTTEER